jgi:hypothetical protein
MDLNSEASARHVLQIWQSRQTCDGVLVAVLAIASAVPAFVFVFAPAAGTAGVLALFLFALGLACARLIDSAARVVRIRGSFRREPLPEIIEAEILDVYEHPGALYAATPQSASAFWIASPQRRPLPTLRTNFPIPASLPCSSVLYQRRIGGQSL